MKWIKDGEHGLETKCGHLSGYILYHAEEEWKGDDRWEWWIGGGQVLPFGTTKGEKSAKMAVEKCLGKLVKAMLKDLKS